MKKKLNVLIITTLLCISTFLVVNKDFEVEASEGGGEEYEGIGLDYDFMWYNITKELSDVVHKENVYPPGTIPKGRAWGTPGDQYTAQNILKPYMEEECGLSEVDLLPIGYLSDYPEREYSSKIVVNDFQITINNDNYPFENPIPTSEIFPIPRGLWNVNENYTYTNVHIRDMINISEGRGELWPFAGTYNNYSLNLTQSGNEYELVIGNVSYINISNNENIPEEQDGMVFIIDDVNGSQEQIDNITNALGCIIMYDNAIGPEHTDTSQCNSSIAKVQKNETNQDNLTQIKNMLENGTQVLVDNVLQNGYLTFTYNLDDCPTLPESGDCGWFLFHKIRPNSETGSYYEDLGEVKLRAYIFSLRPRIKGFFIYDSFDTHFMSYAMKDWWWFGLEPGWQWGDEIEQLLNNPWWDGPGKPIFSINESVGEWLMNHFLSTTISGYLDQEYREQTETTPGVESYNVVGYRNITSSPDDSIVVISNRYDGWWGETPGDSGLGAGIVLGVAKYFNDYNIKPKYNLTFLMTTGEEYGKRGAQHFNDSHQNQNYILWIGADQLGFNQKNTNLSLTIQNDTYTETLLYSIVSAIANETDYPGRFNTDYNYGLNVTPDEGVGGTETSVWKDRCDCICFNKDNKSIWNMYHRAGMNYAEGDVQKNIDRNDSNVTLELFWNVTKYFTVNPDCWIESHNSNISDSDDADDLNDTITVDIDMKSILPDDLVMVNFTLLRPDWYISNSTVDNVVMSKYMNFSVNRSTTSKSINITLPEDETPGFYRYKIDLYNSTGRINEIVGLSGDNINQTEYSGFFFLHPYNYSAIPPEIANVTDSPDPVGYGFNVTISADITSNVTSIDMVTVNISYPDYSLYSFNMSNTVGDTYEYVFDNTWQYGQYDYVIWTKDIYGVENGSSQYSFDVSVNATISVCTVKDSYGGCEIVNLTDPPGDIGSSQQIGYELLDDGEVLRVWNKLDNYYFNTSNGIQFTNHYNEYWSHNVLMLGYYNNDVWNLIYRTDELSGFNKNIDSDNETFVNATLWKDLTYGGYDFRLAIRYYLGAFDNELTVVPYIKNIDDEDIPWVLGFAWEIKDIQIGMTTGGDYIEINGSTYFLNEEDLDETYTNMTVPCFYIQEDISCDESESLYLRWNENLNYVVRVKSKGGQYNAPVTLCIKIGTLDVSQEKYTSLFWYDAYQKVFYFDNYESGGPKEWATNPSYMVDGNISTYASTTIDYDLERCNNNTCDGTDLGTITKVEIRCFGYHVESQSQADIILRPIFYAKPGDDHNFTTPPRSGDWSEWFDITDDTNAPLGWDWFVLEDLFCDVIAKKDPEGQMAFTLYCSKVEVRVTYNVGPVVSDPYPANGSTGVSIAPVLSVYVYDADDDLMNISWLSNSSGSWQVFGSNSSVQTGTYYQTMSNANVNGLWWYWMVNVSDGTNYTLSDVFRFYTGNKSMIENTGSTNFSGYLLMRIDYYNTSSSSWVVEQVVVNESTPRVVNVGGVLGLDTIFNAQSVNTSVFQNGNGTYRVYACLRDPDGNVLYLEGGGSSMGDGGSIAAVYEFTVTFD